MKTYGMNERLPDLDPDPPLPDWECNACGHLFDVEKWAEAFCPECETEDIHRT